MIETLKKGLFETAHYFKEGFFSLPTVILILLCIAGLGIIITMVVVYLSIRRAARKGPPPPSASSESSDEKLKEAPSSLFPKLPPYGGWISEQLSRLGYIKVSQLSSYFLNFLNFLRKNIDTDDYKYSLPWYLVVGPEKSGKTTFIKSLNFDYPFGQPDFTNLHPNPECQWHIFNQAVVMDVRGDLFFKTDQQTDEHNWRSLLILLSRYRSARPLNGIVLTLSATDLYGKNKLSSDELVNRAQEIATKLILTQQNLGLKIPIYVVITKTDIIPGFQSFCSEIPTQYSQNMLGWSNPYTLETAYTPRLVDEAFTMINNHLNQIRLEVLSQGHENEARDGIFVFPSEIASLKDSLSIYLNQIFKNDGFNESLLWRGVYFTGNSGATVLNSIEEGEESASYSTSIQLESRPSHTSPHLFFTHDLWRKKIILEYGLANPLKKRLLTINRGLNVAKIGTAAFVFFGTYGLFNSYERFSVYRDQITPLLIKMNAVLKDVNNHKIYNAQQNSMSFGLNAQELMTLMRHLQQSNFFSFFIPPSWFSNLQKELNTTLKLAYQQIIIRTIYIDLLLKARDLLYLRPAQNDTSISVGQLLQPLTSNEFLLVKRFVEGLETLHQKIEKFNTLKQAADPKDLNELVEYTFQTQLPPEFLNSYEKFRSFLKDIDFPSIELKPYILLARETLNIVFQNFLNAIFTVTHPQSLPARINSFLIQIGEKDKTNIDLDWLRRFSLDLTQAKINLGEPGKTWMDSAIFNPGKEFDELFNKIDHNPMFGHDVSQFLVDQTAIGFQNLQMQLQVINQVLSNYPADLAKSLKDNRGQPIPFSNGIIQLEKALSHLFEEPYMAIPTSYAFTTQIPPGKMIYWDTKLVEVAYDMSKRFEEYMQKNASGLPPALHENLMLIAQQSLQMNVISLIGRAQNFVEYRPDMGDGTAAEEILRTKIREAKESAPKFIKLLEVLNEGSVGYAFIELRTLMFNNTEWLLQQVDKLLDSFSPYAIRDLSFNWWDGKPGLAFLAYNCKDAEDLRVYLGLQRQYLVNLALDFSKPLVAFLTSKVMIDAPGDKSLTNKWRRIVEQVESYKKKQPNNSLALLEDFVAIYMANCDAKNCLKDILIADIKNESGDYFLESLRKIKKALLRRAEVIKRQTSIAHYKTLAEYYNSHLRGQFPFTSSQAREQTPDAEPFRIREFFQKYDQFGGNAQEVLDQIHQLGEDALEAYQFLKSMDKIRVFFSTFVGQGAVNDLPTYDLTIDFRVNRNISKGDDLIVDWSMRTAGVDTVTNHDQTKKLTWIFGQPFEVMFRWADGDSIPLNLTEDSQQPHLIIDGRTVIFKYTGQWSLMWLLKQQAASKMENKDPKSYVLKFMIPTGQGRKTAVYNQITLMKPSGHPKKPGKILTVPDFPSEAPALGEGIIEVAGKPVLTDGTMPRINLDTHPEITEEFANSDEKKDIDEESVSENPEEGD